jgi:ribonuclease-3
MSEARRPDDADPLEQCQAVLRYRFRDVALLQAALTHASGANHRLASNERLEFLGDAILGAVVCDLLYATYPEALEGELTRIKSHVVSRRTCAKLSRKMGLEMFLVLGKGMGGAKLAPTSVLADVFESLVGAMYLDGGLDAARAFILDHVSAEMAAAASGLGGANHKSLLQQLAQRQFGSTPTYRLLDETGPDHSKSFKIAAQIGDAHYVPAWGPTKKDAEQRAARNALSQINGDPVPFDAQD